MITAKEALYLTETVTDTESYFNDIQLQIKEAAKRRHTFIRYIFRGVKKLSDKIEIIEVLKDKGYEIIEVTDIHTDAPYKVLISWGDI